MASKINDIIRQAFHAFHPWPGLHQPTRPPRRHLTRGAAPLERTAELIFSQVNARADDGW